MREKSFRFNVTSTLHKFDQCLGLRISPKFTVKSNNILQNSQELNSIYFLNLNSFPSTPKKWANNGMRQDDGDNIIYILPHANDNHF